MASKPYSVRFMSGRGSSRYETYVVPDGYRAVVTQLAFAWWGVLGYALLSVHGIAVYYHDEPGPIFTSKFEPVRFTAYQGESIVCSFSSTDMSYACDGYLLVDSVGIPDDADNVITPTSMVTPLPAAQDQAA